jgi:hypothetical protein
MASAAGVPVPELVGESQPAASAKSARAAGTSVFLNCMEVR